MSSTSSPSPESRWRHVPGRTDGLRIRRGPLGAVELSHVFMGYKYEPITFLRRDMKQWFEAIRDTPRRSLWTGTVGQLQVVAIRFPEDAIEYAIIDPNTGRGGVGLFSPKVYELFCRAVQEQYFDDLVVPFAGVVATSDLEDIIGLWHVDRPKAVIRLVVEQFKHFLSDLTSWDGQTLPASQSTDWRLRDCFKGIVKVDSSESNQGDRYWIRHDGPGGIHCSLDELGKFRELALAGTFTGLCLSQNV